MNLLLPDEWNCDQCRTEMDNLSTPYDDDRYFWCTVCLYGMYFKQSDDSEDLDLTIIDGSM